jgi:hypothetical protein
MRPEVLLSVRINVIAVFGYDDILVHWYQCLDGTCCVFWFDPDSSERLIPTYKASVYNA